jgi:hypothetical protein
MIGAGIGIAATLIVLALFFLTPEWLKLPYPYTVMGSIALLFPLFLAVTRPAYIPRMTALMPYFFLLSNR